MDGLKTTRVLVIDDEINEATPFIEALAKRGIGSLYFSGTDVDKLPDENDKLTGIRLAAFDMDLDGGDEDERVVIPRLLGIIDRVIAADNGPYLAIAWTKHDDYVTSFRKWSKSGLKCPPVRVIPMLKREYEDIEEIARKVDAEISNSYPLGLLGFWEQSIHESSGSVMRILPECIDWIEHSNQTLKLLLDSAANKKDSSSIKLSALMSAFNSLQLDAIETNAAMREDDIADPLIVPLNDIQRPQDADLKAKLNFRLLCTDVAQGIVPGNIYLCDLCSLETRVFPTLDELLVDMVDPNKADSHEQLKSAGCVSVAMEITPLCDYQQRKMRFPRFLCGLAIPMDKMALLKKPAPFLRSTVPIAFEVPPLKGENSLVWNSHYIVSVPNSLVGNSGGLFRLRQSPLIDVQAWLGSQANRPGYLSISVP